MAAGSRSTASGERLVRKALGERLDAERVRKRDVILQILFEEARQGRVYTASQFAEAFENKAGLGGNTASASGSRCSPPRASSSSSAMQRNTGCRRRGGPASATCASREWNWVRPSRASIPIPAR